MKRLLALAVVFSALLSLCACEAKGEEIARTDFIIDKNNVVEDGFDDFGEFLQGVFDDPDDIHEMAGNNVEPIVEFDDAIYMQIGDTVFPTRMMYYAMSILKSSEINEAILNQINAKDTNEYWDSLAYDHFKSRRQLLIESAQENITNMVITMHVKENYGFSESDNYIYSYENILANYGSEQAIEDYFGAYGLTAELYKEYLRFFCAYNELKEHLIGPEGPFFPDEEDAKKFFYEKCTYFEQIYISYTKVDENGYIIYKTEEEKAEAKARAEALYAKIEETPELFDRNLHLTEHELWAENPKGYCYVPGEIVPELEAKVFELEVGEVGAIETNIGYYIVRPKQKTDEVYEGNNSIIKEALRDSLYQQEMQKYHNQLIVNEEQFTRYDYLDILLLQN